MKPFRWSPEKNETVKAERGASFESMVVSIEAGGLLDILAHPNQAKSPRQRVLVVACDGQTLISSVLHKYVTGRLLAETRENAKPSTSHAAKRRTTSDDRIE